MANIYTSRLTFVRKTKGYPNPKAVYQCSCGVLKEIQISNVKSGHTNSCGCLKRELLPKNTTHNLKRHPLFQVWMGIKMRCFNKNNSCYHMYGGRGVTICDEWRDNFKAFYDWAISNGWEKGLQIDKDIKGSGMLYSPENCSIVTNKENCNHTRRNVILEYNGISKTLSQWSEFYKVKIHTFRHRLKKNEWSIYEYVRNINKYKK